MVVRIRKSGWGRGREEHAWKRGRAEEGKEVEKEGGRAGEEDELLHSHALEFGRHLKFSFSFFICPGQMYIKMLSIYTIRYDSIPVRVATV